MKFSMTKLAAATTLAVAFSSANAAVIDGSTVIASIQVDGGESMLIDTNVATADFRTGGVTSWASNTDLTAAINAFVAGATDVSFWVAGIDNVPAEFGRYAFSNKFLGSSQAVNAMVNSEFQAFANQATANQFATAEEGISEEWLVGIAEGTQAHHENPQIFGNGFVQDSVAATQFFSTQTGLFSGTLEESYGIWSLSTAGLEYNPVPVPAAVWLFGSGLLGLVGVARRRNA